MKKFFGAALALVLFPALAARADLGWKQTTSTTVTVGGKATSMGTAREDFQLKENVVRIDTEDVPVSRFINFQTRSAVVVDFRTKSYAYFSLADLIRDNEQNRAEVMKDLPQREADLAQTPPDKRALNAALIEAQKKKFALWAPGRRYEVVPTEERKAINGHQCVKYLGKSDGETFQEIWVAEDIVLDRLYTPYFATGMGLIDPQQYSHLARVPGFTVKVVSRYGAVTVTDEASKITDAAIPADAFILPEGLVPAANVYEENK